MDESLSKYDLTESTMKNLDSNSDQSDNFEELGDSDDMVTVEDKKKNEEEISQTEVEFVKEDFDNNLPETVTLLVDATTGAKVYLVGTAHFSKQSQEEVVQMINKVQPHMVMLELCDARTALLTLNEETMLEESKKINFENISNLIKKNGLYCGLTYLLILYSNRHIIEELGMAPGGEFRVAYQEAKKIPNCSILLGDRPIKITLMRAVSKLTWFQTFKLTFNLLFSREPIKEEDVENCKKRDMLEQLLAEMSGEYPALGQVFVDERDSFLTNSLQQAVKTLSCFGVTEPIRIVGVVGLGHVIGMKKLWPQDQKEFIDELLIIPPPTLTSRILKTTIKVSFYILAGYLVFSYVPVPKTVKTTCHSGVQYLLQGSRNSISHVVANVRDHYSSYINRYV